MTSINTFSIGYQPTIISPNKERWGSQASRYLSMDQIISKQTTEHVLKVSAKKTSKLPKITRAFNQALKKQQLSLKSLTSDMKSEFVADMEGINKLIEQRREKIRSIFFGLGKLFLAIADKLGLSTKKINLTLLKAQIVLSGDQPNIKPPHLLPPPAYDPQPLLPVPIVGLPSTTKIAEVVKRDGFLHFYDEKNKLTEWLGNFQPCSVDVLGMKFQCSEAAYQAYKFHLTPHQDLMKKFTSLDGAQAWKLAKDNKAHQRADWMQVNDDTMKMVIEEKFLQNPQLKELLLATGDAYLVEHTPLGRDAYWGDNGDGTGKNMLGTLLMVLRGKLGGIGVVLPPPNLQTLINKDSTSSAIPTCKLPGCKKPCWKETSGKVHDYCGKTHAQKAINGKSN